MLTQICKFIIAGCSTTPGFDNEARYIDDESAAIKISAHMSYLTGASSFGVMLNVAALHIDFPPLKALFDITSGKTKLD